MSKLTERRFHILININIIYKTKVIIACCFIPRPNIFFLGLCWKRLNSHHYFSVGVAHVQDKIMIEIQ